MSTVNGSGNTPTDPGVVGTSVANVGVYGESQTSEGVFGQGHAGAGVSGRSDQWIGVYGESKVSEGVRGQGDAGAGVSGLSVQWIGVYGQSTTGEGMHAETQSTTSPAMAVYQKNPASKAAALFARHEGAGMAAHFEGDVEVTGDIRLLNADCAEDFDVLVGETAEPGTVMVIDDSGALAPCRRAYDKRVAGVVSGGGDYKPAIVLDQQAGRPDRRPIALLGKVCCKVDARFGAIEIGDLLTTCSTPGYAMKAASGAAAFGAVIGKALRPLAEGECRLLPILIALQ